MSTETNKQHVESTVEESINAIILEAEQHGLAFVEDDWAETEDGDEIFNPFTDKETSIMWLREKLLEVYNLSKNK